MTDEMAVEELQFTENGIEPKPVSARSAGTSKAWETRRANKAKAAAQAGSSVDAVALRTLIQRVYEKREEYAAVTRDLEAMEAELESMINRMTGK
jgi:hypothetical protein